MHKNDLKFGFGILLALLIVIPLFVSCAGQGTTPSTSQPGTIPATTTSATSSTSKPSTTPATNTSATSTASTPAPQKGGIFKLVSPAVSSFGYPPDPGLAAVQVANQPCVESLLAQDPGGNPLPRLVTAWQIGADGKSITLTLRKGVKFQDGSDFNAQVTKWMLDLQLAAKTTGTSSWTSVDVVDDYTVRINLSKWDNTVLPNLSGQVGEMISQTAFQKNGIDWARVNPVGTGPFKFQSFQRDASITYVRNDNYWGDKAYLDGIQIVFISDSNAQAAALKAGEVDAARDMDFKTASALQKVGFNIIYKSSFTYVFTVDSGNADSPYANQKVREAIDYAIDKDGITKALGYGFESPAYQVSPPDYSAYVSSLPARAYDKAKAKQLLSDAGYPNGFKTTLYLRSDQDQEAMTAVQGQLATVGIMAQIQVVDNAAFSQLGQQGWHNGLVFTPWGLNPFFASVLTMRFSPTYQISQLRPPDLLSILNDMTAAKDTDTTIALSQKAVTYIYNNELVIPLWFSGSNVVIKPSIHDTGFLTSDGITGWTPAKVWIGK